MCQKLGRLVSYRPALTRSSWANIKAGWHDIAELLRRRRDDGGHGTIRALPAIPFNGQTLANRISRTERITRAHHPRAANVARCCSTRAFSQAAPSAGDTSGAMGSRRRSTVIRLHSRQVISRAPSATASARRSSVTS